MKRQVASGLSVREFCRRESLTKSAFYAWRLTIGERYGDARPATSPPAKPRLARVPAFVPVAVTDQVRRETGIVIELAGGRVLRLPDSISAARLAELVVALESRDAP